MTNDGWLVRLFTGIGYTYCYTRATVTFLYGKRVSQVKYPLLYH